MQTELDDIDLEVIRYLEKDGRASASEIAQHIGKVSERTIRNRIAALLQNRRIVIGAIPDPTVEDPGVQAELLIEIEPGELDNAAAYLQEFDQVGYLAATSGTYNLSASIYAPTNAEMLDFVERQVSKAPGLQSTNLSFVMRLYKIYATRTNALSPEPSLKPNAGAA